MESFSLSVFQRKDGCIEVGLFGIPKLGAICTKLHFCFVAGNNISRTCGHLFPIGVDDIDAYFRPINSTIQIDISRKETISLGIYRYALRRLADDEYWAPDAAKIPVVGPALSKVHLRIGALLQYFNLQSVLLCAKKDTIGNINCVSGESALIGSLSSLATIDGHTGLCKYSLEHQLYLSPLPFCRQRKLSFILSCFIGNTLWCGFTIEAHAVLVGPEALKFPTRRHSYLGPFPTIATIGAEEVPWHHIVATMTTQILSLCLHQRLRLHC